MGMIVLVTSSTAVGLLLSNKAKEQYVICEQLIIFCNMLLIDFGYTKTSATKLVDKTLQNEQLCKLDFINSDFVKQLKKPTSSLSDDENLSLAEFLFSLGKSDIKGQISLTENFKEYLLQIKNKYYQNYVKNSKLYITFGFFSGVVFSLVMI
jgi:stage III sporulation protein AB